MRLVLAVVQSADVHGLLMELAAIGISATQIEGDAAVGRASSAAIIAGVEDDRVEDVIGAVNARARGRIRQVEPVRPIAERAEFWIPGPVEQPRGGASVYVLPVRRFERIGYA
jgi:uncharacterized protein YaaQ